jgi:hypothetical protein
VHPVADVSSASAAMATELKCQSLLSLICWLDDVKDTRFRRPAVIWAILLGRGGHFEQSNFPTSAR